MAPAKPARNGMSSVSGSNPSLITLAKLAEHNTGVVKDSESRRHCARTNQPCVKQHVYCIRQVTKIKDAYGGSEQSLESSDSQTWVNISVPCKSSIVLADVFVLMEATSAYKIFQYSL